MGTQVKAKEGGETRRDCWLARGERFKVSKQKEEEEKREKDD